LLKVRICDDDDDYDEDDIGWPGIFATIAGQIPRENITILFLGGQDISVDIATRYGLEGPRIEFRWRARFSALVQTGSEAHPASCIKVSQPL
jgi:hypothetical protein